MEYLKGQWYREEVLSKD